MERILEHSIELLELRGEDTTQYRTELYAIEPSRFQNEFITLKTQNIRMVYAMTKDSFKDFWATLKTMDSEAVLKVYDTTKFIVLVSEYPPSITMQSIHQKELSLQESNGFIHLFLTKELIYNPMKHKLVPKHEKISEEEAKILVETMQLKSKNQLPMIQKQDVISRWLGLVPGDIVKITRYNETSGEYYYYRVCM